METDSSSVIVEREVDGGLESVKLKLPAVVTFVSYILMHQK